MSIIQSLVNLSQYYSNHCFIVEITIGSVDEEVSPLKLELSFSATVVASRHQPSCCVYSLLSFRLDW